MSANITDAEYDDGALGEVMVTGALTLASGVHRGVISADEARTIAHKHDIADVFEHALTEIDTKEAYRPDQPRDHRGRFTDVPGSGVVSSIAEYIADTRSDAADHMDEHPGMFDMMPIGQKESTRVQAVIFDWLEERQGVDPEPPAAGFRQNGMNLPDFYHVEDVAHFWTIRGFKSDVVKPAWEAAREVTGRGEAAEIPDFDRTEPYFRDRNVPQYLPELASDDRVLRQLTDYIAFSQEFASRVLADENGQITLWRGLTGGQGEDTALAKDFEAKLEVLKSHGTPFEVDPRAMESWTRSETFARTWRDGTRVKRTVKPEDVAYITDFLMPNIMMEEVTLLGNEPYEIGPENITTGWMHDE